MPIYNMVRSPSPASYVPPTWTGGTDAEIVEALEKHYAGKIDLTEYWSVGDERVVSLSAMSATGVGESHVAQDATFVIMNVGGKTLADGTTECAFIVGMKDSLNEEGYMDDSNYASQGWNGCKRRTWCNSVFYNAIPSALRPIFKQHLNKTRLGIENSSVDSVDYFAFPAEYEVFGAYTNSSSTYEAGLTQFEYYKTTLNRIKNESGTRNAWWERSPYNYLYFCKTGNDGSGSVTGGAQYTSGISPFGVI